MSDQDVELAFQFIRDRLGELNDGMVNVNKKVDALIGKRLLTQADCEKCKEKKHGVSGKKMVAYMILCACIGAFGSNLLSIGHWLLIQIGVTK